MIALIAQVALAGSCDDGLSPSLDALHAALSQGDASTAEIHQSTIEGAFKGCGDPASPQTLRRWWLLEGILRGTRDEDDAALDAFRASSRLGPHGDWPWGAELEALWDSAAKQETAMGTLVMRPGLGTHHVYIDGTPQPAGPTLPVPAGLHALQVATLDGKALFSTILYLEQGLETTVDTGIPTGVAKIPSGKRFPVLPVVVGGVGVASLATSFLFSQRMNKSPDGAALRTDYRAHAATRIGGVTLMAASGVLFTVHVVR